MWSTLKCLILDIFLDESQDQNGQNGAGDLFDVRIVFLRNNLSIPAYNCFFILGTLHG